MSTFAASTLSRALRRLDPQGRFHPDDLPDLRGVVEELREGGDALDHPASIFGPWEELDPVARNALRLTLEKDISAAMDFYPQGSLWTGLVRGGWELDRFFHHHGVPGWIRRGNIRWISRFHGGPLNARNKTIRIQARRGWEKGRNVGITHLLHALGRTPQWLQGDFVQGARVDPRARGIFHDPARNVVHAYFVGLDLMPTPQGICCVEANLEAGIVEKRKAVLPENHIVLRVLKAARDHGVKRVQWWEGRHVHLPNWMLRDLHELPIQNGLPLEVLEDPTVVSRPSPSPDVPIPHRWSFDRWVPDDTLILRRSGAPVGPGFLVSHKGAFVRGAGRILEKRNERRVYIPSMTRIPEEVPEPQNPGLPNLVYKFPQSSRGRGVFFLKARDRGHAVALARELDKKHGEAPGLFQPFVTSVLPDGRRIFGFRFEVLVSPLGCWYLASFLRAGAQPFPDEVPYGIVPGNKIFVADPAVGSDFEILEPEMEQEYREAALVVADALREALMGTFQIRPD